MVTIKEIRATFRETRWNVYKTQKIGIRPDIKTSSLIKGEA